MIDIASDDNDLLSKALTDLSLGVRNLVYTFVTFSNRIYHNTDRESSLPETDEGRVGFDTLKHKKMKIFLRLKK